VTEPSNVTTVRQFDWNKPYRQRNGRWAGERRPNDEHNSNPYPWWVDLEDEDGGRNACLIAADGRYWHDEDEDRDGRDLVNYEPAVPPSVAVGCFEPSNVTQRLIAELRDRDAKGRAKYGVTLDRTDLKAAEWCRHMRYELLDASGYVTKIEDAVEALEAENAALRAELARLRDEQVGDDEPLTVESATRRWGEPDETTPEVAIWIISDDSQMRVQLRRSETQKTWRVGIGIGNGYVNRKVATHGQVRRIVKELS